VPHVFGLLNQRCNQIWMAVSEGIDSNARSEIEIALTVAGGEPGTLAVFKGEVHTRVSWQQMRRHRDDPLLNSG
jgi:hypothetical protein